MTKQKCVPSFNFLLYEKCIPNILMIPKTKSAHCVPQTATFTPFRSLIPAVSCLLKFGLPPENGRKIKKLQTLSFMELTSSSAYAEYK